MNYIEKLIVTKVIKALIKGYPDKHIVVDGDRGYDPDAGRYEPVVNVEAVINDADQYEGVHLFVDGPEDGRFDEEGYPVEAHGPWVYLIFGNGNGGWDVVADYDMSLEPEMQPIMDWILKEMNG